MAGSKRTGAGGEAAGPERGSWLVPGGATERSAPATTASAASAAVASSRSQADTFPAGAAALQAANSAASRRISIRSVRMTKDVRHRTDGVQGSSGHRGRTTRQQGQVETSLEVKLKLRRTASAGTSPSTSTQIDTRGRWWQLIAAVVLSIWAASELLEATPDDWPSAFPPPALPEG